MAALVPAKELRAAARFVASVVERRSSIPIMKYAKIEMAGEALSISATNLDNTATVRVPCTGKIKPVCLPAKALAAIAARLDGEIKIDGAAVSANGTRYELTDLPADDFPDNFAGIKWGEPIMPPTEFRRGLARAAFAVSEEETRYYLNGVFFRPGAAAATDGHRLVAVPLNGNGVDFKPIIVHRNTVAVARQMPQATDAEVRTCEAARLMIREGDYQLVARLIDGTFPDYERAIPDAADAKCRFTVLTSELAAGLRRLSPLTSGRMPGIKFAVSGATLALSAINVEYGMATDHVPLEASSGDPIEIGFNPRYVADFCKSGVERLHWNISDSASACRIETDDGLLFALMPMRL